MEIQEIEMTTRFKSASFIFHIFLKVRKVGFLFLFFKWVMFVNFSSHFVNIIRWARSL